MQLPTVSQTSMDLALQVEIGALELTTVLQNLATSLRDAAMLPEPISNPTTAFDLTFSQPTTSSTEANSKVQEARRAVRVKTAEIRTLLAEPADLLQ